MTTETPQTENEAAGGQSRAGEAGANLTAVLEGELDWARMNCKLQLTQHNDQGAQYWEGVSHGLVKAINAAARSNNRSKGDWERPGLCTDGAGAVTTRDCICEGNWRALVAESEPLLERKYKEKDGAVYTFFGLVHGADDYYYGLIGPAGLKLVSCVISLESCGYELLPKDLEEASPC